MNVWEYLALVVVTLYVVGFFLSLGSKFMKKYVPPKVQAPSKTSIVPQEPRGEN
jgi:uncharacterized membrane protein